MVPFASEIRYSISMTKPDEIGKDMLDDEVPIDPPWDEAKAKKLLGAIVFIGITYVAPDRIQKKLVQCHGMVTQVISDKGIEIECHGQRWNGQKIWMPPDLSMFHNSPPGIYKLRETGEEIVDPDFSASCTIYLPQN